MEFSWTHLTIAFPEYIKENGWEVDSKGKLLMERGNFGLRFGAKCEYGAHVVFPNSIPVGIWKEFKTIRDLEIYCRDFPRNVFSEVKEELRECIPIFEKWRNFVSRRDPKQGWVGNLQNYIEFCKHNSQVSFYDYYHFRNSSDNNPTSQILRLENFPEEVLNERGKYFKSLSEKIGKSNCNYVFGKSLLDCVKEMDKIYSIASELEELSFK